MTTAGATCAACGGSIESGQEIKIVGTQKTGPITLCEGCAGRAEQLFRAETEDANVGAAIWLGALAGLVSALVWFGVVVVTDYQLGIVAVGVGWLVAQAVMFGAGKRRGGALPWISLIVTGLAMILAEYLIVRHHAAQYLADEGVKPSLLLPLGLSASLILESVKSDPLTVVFWIIALIEAAGLPRRRRLRRV